MALNPPSGIVNWFNPPIGERGWNAFRAHLTGKDYPGTSRKTSYVKLSEEEANEVIENIKKDPEGIPIFDEANAPDKPEEYQKWLVARYFTKAREEGFESRKQEGTNQLEEELGPEGLDELLNLIREESKVEVGASTGGGGDSPASSPSPPSPPPSSSALAVVPKKEDDLVEEEIDPQILSILGLQDVFDLTYEEYYRELRTAATAGRMPGSQMSRESIKLVTEELKRVKGKTGRFKVKPKKLDINKVLDRKQPSSPGAIVKADKLIPQPEESLQETEEKSAVDVENLQDDLMNGIGNILESLITIRTTLQSQSKTEQQAEEEDRKETEKKKKKERESKLEKKKPQSPILKALTKPVGDFFESIKKFFTNVILGSVVLGIFKWLKDPKNKQAIDDFTNFIENNLDKVFNGILALIGLRIGWKIFKWTRRLYKAFSWLKGKLPGGKPKPSPKPTSTRQTPPQTPSQMQGGSNTGLFYGKNVDPKTGRQLRSGPSISRYNESSARIIQSKANIGDKLRVGFRDTTYGIRNFLGKANRKLSSSWEFVKNKFSPAISNKIKSFAPKLRGLGFGAFRALGSILRLIGLGFLIAELRQDWNNKDYYAIIVKLAAYGAGWIVTSLGFLASGALVSTGLGSPAGIALSVVSMAAGAGTDAAIRHFLLKGRKKTQSPEPKDPYAGADGLQRQLDDLAKAQQPAVQPQTSLMPGLPPTNTLPGKQHYGAARPGGRKHAGVDFDAGDNDTFYSRIGGEVIYSANAGGGYGNVVDVYNKELGVTERIAEGSKNLVKVGQNISPGTPVQQGTHQTGVFHYEIRKGKATGSGSFEGTLDPIAFLKNPTTQTQVAQSPTAQVAQTAPPTPSIPSPTGRGNIVPLPIPTGGGSQQASSGTAPNQAPVPRFSSEDPNNTTTMVVRAIYNIVG